MTFCMRGLDPQPYRHLYGMSDAELAARRAVRYHADEKPGFPDRVSLCDAEIGAPVLLVNHVHLDVPAPTARAMRSSLPKARRRHLNYTTRFQRPCASARCRFAPSMRRA